MSTGFLYKWTDRLPKAHGVYVVGGTVRDLLLGYQPEDCDLVTESDPLDYARRLAGSTGGRLVFLGKPGKMIYRVVTVRMEYDVCPVEGGSITADLKRRDFTINALAQDVGSGKILDVTGGRRDIKNRRICMTSRAAFDADPLRLLRAYRIGASLGFDIEPDTAAAISRHADRIKDSAAERIHAELIKLFKSPGSCDYLVQMAQSGLLFAIFPELTALVNCTQNRYHRYDVWHHTLAAYCHLEQLLAASRRAEQRVIQLFQATSLDHGLLKFAMLIHDIGKPLTRTCQDNASVHFYGHHKKGAQLAAAIADRLRCSSSEKEQLRFLVENHMRPMQLFLLDRTKQMTPRALARFFVKCGQRTPDILFLALADHIGKGFPDRMLAEDFSAFVMNLFDRYRRGVQHRLKMPLPISGHDLIRDLGLPPSPLFACILAEIRKAFLAGAVTDRASALALSSKIARKHSKKSSKK